MPDFRTVSRQMLFWGAFFLIVWAGYELVTRVDAMARPIGMFVHMAQGEKIPFFRALSYVDWRIVEQPAFLLNCVILGILSFVSMRKPLWALVIIPLTVLSAFWGLGHTALMNPNFLQKAKLTPLVIILLGSVFGLSTELVRRQRLKKHRPLPRAMDYDPFHQKRREPDA